MNRALELPQVQRIAVWGCGNFECWGWHRIWGNHRDVRSGRLAVHPWADDRSPADQARPGAITRESWRGKFERFAAGLDRGNVYVTVDIDGLCAADAVTNWGKRPLHGRRRGVGARCTLPARDDPGGRSVRRAFGTRVCALDPAVRFRDGSPRVARVSTRSKPRA